MDTLFQALSRWVAPRQAGALPLSWSGRLVAALLGLLAGRIIARSLTVWSRHAMEPNGLSIPFPQRDAHIVSQTAAGQ